MTGLRFIPAEYDSGRIAARSGTVVVGAVFPALNQPGAKWRWRLWITDSAVPKHGEARSEIAAKNALAAAWGDFLRAANLVEKEKAA